nr:unnamed protein product [Callosobruchus chinensis]
MTDAIDEGRFHKVPLLFGMNSEECLSPVYLGFLPQIKRKAEKWDEEIWKMIDSTVNVEDKVKAAQDMKVFYADETFSEDPAAVVKFCTDDEFTLPIGRHAESASKNGVPVYMYMMDHKYVPHFVPVEQKGVLWYFQYDSDRNLQNEFFQTHLVSATLAGKIWTKYAAPKIFLGL